MATAIGADRVIDNVQVDRFTDAPRIAEHAITIQAPAETVWSTLVDPEHIPSWVGMVRRVELDHTKAECPGEMGRGTVRTYVFYGGVKVRELIQAWEPPHLFAYTTLGFPLVKDQLGVVTVDPVSPTASRMTWRQFVTVPGLFRPLVPLVLRLVLTRLRVAAEARNDPSGT
ncbi:MAG: hypothetical protein CL878_07830 [Dehalococcoidia bacterium]|nr:hypothetical protein [Dehalococcoidia bacterium]